jgi:hypothetical protein
MLLALGVPGCGGDPAPAGTGLPAGVLLAGDGIEVRLAELEAWLPYFDGVDRHASRNAKLRGALALHVLPIALARRAHAARRDDLRRDAEAMARVVGNGGFPELLVKGRPYGALRPANGWVRSELPIAVARLAFDPERLGQVSPVLETPQGFALIATSELRPGVSTVEDRVDAVLVTFYTHPPGEFEAWLRAEYERLAGRIRVHPDHLDLLPETLRP